MTDGDPPGRSRPVRPQDTALGIAIAWPVVYVRQSSPPPGGRESRVGRLAVSTPSPGDRARLARAPGSWSSTTIRAAGGLSIDNRPGFQRLLAEGVARRTSGSSSAGR